MSELTDEMDGFIFIRLSDPDGMFFHRTVKNVLATREAFGDVFAEWSDKIEVVMDANNVHRSNDIFNGQML